MRNNIFIVSVLVLGFGSVVFAAPYFRQEASLVPIDATENIGTSTAPWDEGHFNEICLSADCKTVWPTGGSGGTGTVSTSTNETAGRVPYWTTTSGTPAKLGEIATSSITINAPLTSAGTAGYVLGGSGWTIDIDDIKAADLDLTDITLNDFTNDAGFLTTVDISDDTNLAATWPIVLTGDTLSTAFSTTTNSGMSAGNLYVGSGGIFQTAASSSIFGYTPLNPTRQLTVAGTANQITSSAGAQDLSADRTWTLSFPNHIIFPGNFQATNSTTTNATTTSLYVTGAFASTTQFYAHGLASCTGDNYLTWSGGVFGCAADDTTTGAADFTFESNYGALNAATSSILWAKSGLNASSTSHFVNASTTLLTAKTIYGPTNSALTLNATGNANDINLNAADAASGNGGGFSFTAGNGNSAGNGGLVSIFSGDGGATGDGGDFSLSGGRGGATSGSGGDFVLTAGSAQGTDSNGGDILLIGGDATGAGVHGEIRLQTGGESTYAILDTSALSSDKTFTFPNLTGSLALGSYATGFTGGHIPFGSSGLLATSSSLTFDGTRLTATYASSTAISAPTICIDTDCRTSWPTGTVTGSGSANRLAFWDAASSISSNAALITNAANTTIALGASASNSRRLSILTDGTVTQGIAASGDTASRVGLASFVTGDAQLRFSFLLDGTMKWSDGTNAPDVQLSRTGANILSLASGDTFTADNVGVGTTTQVWPLTAFSATQPQLALSSGAGFAQWTQRNSFGTLYFATTTVAGTATSTTFGLRIDSDGKIVGWDATNRWTGPITPTRAFALSTATTTTWTASTTSSGYSPFLVMPFAGTLRQVRCATDASFVGVNVQVNGSNATPSYFVASTTVGKVSFTAGNTFSAGQKVLANFGTTTTATTKEVSCTFDVTET